MAHRHLSHQDHHLPSELHFVRAGTEVWGQIEGHCDARMGCGGEGEMGMESVTSLVSLENR